jgi:hypothetical protein
MKSKQEWLEDLKYAVDGLFGLTSIKQYRTLWGVIEEIELDIAEEYESKYGSGQFDA